MNDYKQAIDYLYNKRPAFERQGADGYKPGLETTISLDNAFGNPHTKYRVIHVAGTNGKGSVSHMLAAILQAQGYKVGLYTSPHFVDFSERIKVDGHNIPHNKVIAFVKELSDRKLGSEASFFELTTALAFKYFEECEIDIAVVEVGLGGRLDCTNIVTPILSIITNISLDHTEFLGNTLQEIASEKAGIIKPGIPVVVGESNRETKPVFIEKALAGNSPITFAHESDEIKELSRSDGFTCLTTETFGQLKCQLAGSYQRHNILTVLEAVKTLRKHDIAISDPAVKTGLERVCEMTSFRGRWTILKAEPYTVCDSAHNEAGLTEAMSQLAEIHYQELHFVIGVMADKDVEKILSFLPKRAIYYFTQADTPRALKASALQLMAGRNGLKGEAYPSVQTACEAALKAAHNDDAVYVGGSMYVLAELFAIVDKKI